MNCTKNIHELLIQCDTYHLNEDIINQLDKYILKEYLDTLDFNKYSLKEYINGISFEIKKSLLHDSDYNIIIKNSFTNENIGTVNTSKFKNVFFQNVITEEIISYITFNITKRFLKETLEYSNNIRLYE